MKLLKYIAGFFLIILFLSFFFGINRMAGSNMEPVIKNGETLLIWKYFLSGGNPRRGDLVIYRKNTNGKDIIYPKFVGRVIALSKEAVRFDKGSFYIDNNAHKYKVEEEYLSKGTKTYVNTTDGNSPAWVQLEEYDYLIIPDKRDKPFNVEEQIINKNDIEGTVIFHL